MKNRLQGVKDFFIFNVNLVKKFVVRNITSVFWCLSFSLSAIFSRQSGIRPSQAHFIFIDATAFRHTQVWQALGYIRDPERLVLSLGTVDCTSFC